MKKLMKKIYNLINEPNLMDINQKEKLEEIDGEIFCLNYIFFNTIY